MEGIIPIWWDELLEAVEKKTEITLIFFDSVNTEFNVLTEGREGSDMFRTRMTDI